MTIELDKAGLVSRITAYLCSGGLFNPELANHEAVRELLRDCRAYLEATHPPAQGDYAELVDRTMGSIVTDCEKQKIFLGTVNAREIIHKHVATTITSLSAKLQETETQLAEANKALEPFAQHLDEMGFDIDNNGNPLPDEQTVGWVYVTIGHFRAARRTLNAGGA